MCWHVSMWGFQNLVRLSVPREKKSVCPYPEKKNHLSFVNISPTLVIDTSMERSSWFLYHEEPKTWFSLKINAYLTYICINYMHIYVFRQVCTIEPSFFETTSGMHRRPFECRHLVLMCSFFMLELCGRLIRIVHCRGLSCNYCAFWMPSVIHYV